MNRLRFSDVQEPIARVLNVAQTDPIVMARSNEAHRRLVAKDRWVGTTQRYRICTSAAGCLTWPRQVETIESYWRCDYPGIVRNGWYETSLNTYGLLDSNDMMSNALIDRGTACAFDVITGSNSSIRVVADVTESATARILLRGWDTSGQWIRTQDPAGSGNWIDGEYVAVSTVATNSTNRFSSLTEVIKPITNGPVRLYEYDNDLAAIVKAIAYYEPDEEVPIYRCSIIPGIGNIHGCGNPNGTSCSSNVLTVIVKLRHIDVRTGNDFFLLGNLAALKLMVMAILKEERNLFDEAMAYEAKAVRELQNELNSFEGNGQVPIWKTESPQTWGAGVLNPVTLGTRIY